MTFQSPPISDMEALNRLHTRRLIKIKYPSIISRKNRAIGLRLRNQPKAVLFPLCPRIKTLAMTPDRAKIRSMISNPKNLISFTETKTNIRIKFNKTTRFTPRRLDTTIIISSPLRSSRNRDLRAIF